MCRLLMALGYGCWCCVCALCLLMRQQHHLCLQLLWYWGPVCFGPFAHFPLGLVKLLCRSYATVIITAWIFVIRWCISVVCEVMWASGVEQVGEKTEGNQLTWFVWKKTIKTGSGGRCAGIWVASQSIWWYMRTFPHRWHCVASLDNHLNNHPGIDNAVDWALDLQSAGYEFDAQLGSGCVMTLCKLFTPMYPCHQAVLFGTGQWVVTLCGW